MYDIFVVGLGTMSWLQITHEAKQSLELCKKIFFLHTEPHWVQPYLERLCHDVVDLDAFYKEGEDRILAYKGMTKAILAEARVRGPVGVALYGSPMVFVTPTRLLTDLAPRLNLKIKVLPGISAMECMFVDLGVDPSDGFITYEANDLLLRRRPLLSDIHTFIWQVGGVESELFARANSRPERFIRLRDYLLAEYPEDHEILIITCATLPNVKPQITKAKLSQLQYKNQEMHQGATLYLPPVSRTSEIDKAYLRLLTSEDHLRSITEVHDTSENSKSFSEDKA